MLCAHFTLYAEWDPSVTSGYQHAYDARNLANHVLDTTRNENSSMKVLLCEKSTKPLRVILLSSNLYVSLAYPPKLAYTPWTLTNCSQRDYSTPVGSSSIKTDQASPPRGQPLRFEHDKGVFP